jgi:hypothetical protein
MTFEQIADIPAFNDFYNVRNELERHIYGRSERAFAREDARRDAIRSRPALARFFRTPSTRTPRTASTAPSTSLPTI